MNQDAIYDARQLGVPKMLLLGLPARVRHVWRNGARAHAITGLTVTATLLFAGLGTLLFHLLTERKVPAFLGTSFAFLGGYAAAKKLVDNSGTGAETPLPYAGIGVACAGSAVSCIVARAVQGLWRPVRSCVSSRRL